LKSQGIVSRYLSKIRSPIRPLELPYHVENLAHAMAAAPSLPSSPKHRRPNRDAEQYFELHAEVDNVVLCDDSDSEHGSIESTSNDNDSEHDYIEISSDDSSCT